MPLRHLFARALAWLIAIAALAGAGWSGWSWQPAVWAKAHLERAQALASAHDNERARAAYRELLRRLPDEREARWQLVQLEMQDHRFEQAYLEAKACSELFPERAEAWLLIATLMNSGGLLDEAEAATDEALAAAPGAMEAHALRARIRFHRGRFYGAAVDARVALSRWPDSAPLKAVLEHATAAMNGAAPAPQAARIRHGMPRERGELVEGHAMVWPGPLAELRRDSEQAMQKKDWAGVAQVVRRARQSFPGSVIGPWIAGVGELAQDHYAAAERFFDEALVSAPRSALIVKGLAQAWAREGNAGAAADKLLERVQRDPGFAFARRHAANLYLAARRPDLAENALRQGVEHPGDAGAYRDLAAFYQDLDRAGDALKVCQDGLARYPQDLDLQSLAARLTSRSDPAKAAGELEAILKMQPDRTGDAVGLANLLVDAPATRARALELLRQVEYDAPSELEQADGLGWALLRAGEPMRAIPWLEAASQSAPERPDVRYHLAAAYARAGRKADARVHLDFLLKSGAVFSEQPQAQRLQQALRPR